MSRGYRDGDSRRYFDWLYYANLDLLAAKNLQCDERCYNGAAFHCQQCIEKALKGYLLLKNTVFTTVITLHGCASRQCR